jgi:hypothetical protein
MAIEIPDSALESYGDVWHTLNHIKDTIETFYAQAGVALPERRFLAVGDVADSVSVDCEQMNVNYIRSYFGLPGQPDLRPSNCELLMSADFVIQVTRCVLPRTRGSRGALSAPTTEFLDDKALFQSVDAGLLLESAHAMSSAQGVSAAVSPAGVQGEYQSMQLNLSISLSRF